eukprot:6186697-Pleurochrysis_carterae.AAC.2
MDALVMWRGMHTWWQCRHCWQSLGSANCYMHCPCRAYSRYDCDCRAPCSEQKGRWKRVTTRALSLLAAIGEEASQRTRT